MSESGAKQVAAEQMARIGLSNPWWCSSLLHSKIFRHTRIWWRICRRLGLEIVRHKRPHDYVYIYLFGVSIAFCKPTK